MIKVPSMQELLEAGVHFGHQVRRGNPKMYPFIYGARDGVHILDLAKSEEKLKLASEAAYKLGKEGKVMLLLGTKKQAREVIESLAKEVGAPYLTQHWVGGLLTNFDEIKKNLKKLAELAEEKDKGTLSRYTKKEQLLIDRKLQKFDLIYGGLKDLDKIPDAIFIVDVQAESTAVKEANRVGITTIGFADTNANPNLLDFPIPANDDGIKAIKLVSETVIRLYGEGKKESASGKVETAKSEEVKVSEELDEPVKEQAEVLEEEVEKQIVEESSRKE